MTGEHARVLVEVAARIAALWRSHAVRADPVLVKGDPARPHLVER
jgi:hypothetical protein